MKAEINIISNPLGLNKENLFGLAARKNKKRGFLFVSRVLGKHVPVAPERCLNVGYALAYLYAISQGKAADKELEKELRSHLTGKQEHLKNKKEIEIAENVICLGFAETATALGFSVFSSFAGEHYYLHSTREKLGEIEADIEFREEHSHAVTHRIYLREEKFLKKACPLLLIDDELTTGKTALNLIRALQKKFPRREYALLTILDWRTPEDEQLFRKAEQELSVKISVISLLRGSFKLEAEFVTEERKKEKKRSLQAVAETINLGDYFPHRVRLISVDSSGKRNKSPYLQESGRFGISSEEWRITLPLLAEPGSFLRAERKSAKTLCLGSEEFMQLPLLLAKEMGEGVVFHSSTQSPIYPCAKEDYEIKEAHSFSSPFESTRTNYLYNISPGEYEEVFFFLERTPLLEDYLKFIKGLRALPIKRLVIVNCGEREPGYLGLSPSELPELGSYPRRDCLFLLRDLKEAVPEQSTEERERAIQSGTHYSEMLPIEYFPPPEYLQLFHQSLEQSAARIAELVGILAEKIIAARGDSPVLVSLARAGTPVGVLLKRYLEDEKGLMLPHYGISIIRDKGIDENALRYILRNHPQQELQFLDGWTGKGTILGVLEEACREFKNREGIELNPDLAALADPGGFLRLTATREDFLLPSACLNATVSGLISRTVYRTELLGEGEFHGVKYYQEWKDEDLSNHFIERIAREFSGAAARIRRYSQDQAQDFLPEKKGSEDVARIKKDFAIEDINHIKPGVGETTRVLLRRIPWKVLVKDFANPDLAHILLLAKEKGVEVEHYPLSSYACCGLIKKMELES